MTDFNPDAAKHPCMKCVHTGGIWKEGGKTAGNVCKHPDITAQRGLFYGLFFTCKRPHKRCPLGGIPEVKS